MKYLQLHTYEEIYQYLNNRLSTLSDDEIQNILFEYRQNLIFTNIISEVYNIVILFLKVLDTYQIKKHENIRQKNIKFLLNFLDRFDDEKFNEYINKNYNIFENKQENKQENENKLNYYFLNRKMNRQYTCRVFIKFILAQKTFEKLFFKTLNKRYAPYGPGYFEAKNSFEKQLNK